MAELKALSKLKMAGKLHYWRGTIEIDEHELHEICDEIQAEYDKAVAAMNRAAGNWAKADTELRKPDGKSRWFRLFGTPERAAQMMIAVRNECESSGPCYPRCQFGDAPACPSNCESSDYDMILEWLRGDA